MKLNESPNVPAKSFSKTRTTIISLGLIAFLVWFYFAPYLVLHSMKSAMDAKDASKLALHVNFSAIKDNLKASFNDKITAQTAQNKSGNPFASAGAAFATAAVGPMVEAMVTPENLALVLQSAQALNGKQDASKDAAANGKPTSTEADNDMSMAYESFNRFAVTVTKKGEKDAADQPPLGLVLHRENLFSWRLSALRLPL
jgi:hypothetical protein